MPTSPDPNSVLIVEDDWRIANLWRETLEKSGLRVVLEDNVEQAILTLQQERFDVAVVDLMLKDLSGVENRESSLMLLANLGINSFQAPRVLAVSGYKETTDLYQRYGILSPINTLNKPLSPDQLKMRIYELIEQKSREEEATNMAIENQRWALQRFKFATDHSQDAIYWIDKDGHFFYVNDGACQMLGYSQEKLLQLKINDIDPDYPQNVWSEHWNRMRQERFEILEPTHIDSNGRHINTLMHTRYYTYEGDEFIIGTARDISELKHYTAQLEKANRELAEFTYIASHDLKAPLRAIDQIAGWLKEDLAGKLPADSEKHLNSLTRRINRMDDLLYDLLAYSRAGTKREETSTIDLADLIDEVTSLAVSDVQFEVEADLQVASITSKRTPLATILRNLISNAVKHHDKSSGKIHVRCFKSEVDEQTLQFSVIDDGPGIDAKYHDKAFAIFKTLRPRDQVEGSGMGLALVKRTVEAEGGRVWIESNEPRGSKLHFTWR